MTDTSNISDAQMQLLVKQPQFTPEQVSIICKYIEDFGDSGSVQAEAIIEKKLPGQDAKISVVTGRAVLINWKQILVDAVAPLSATAAAATGHTALGVAGAIGLAITAVKALSGVAIEVDNDEARRIVLQLWRELPFREVDETTITKLSDALGPRITKDVLSETLQDLAALGILEIRGEAILKKNRLFSW
jgi:hypothetical protein